MYKLKALTLWYWLIGFTQQNQVFASIRRKYDWYLTIINANMAFLFQETNKNIFVLQDLPSGASGKEPNCPCSRGKRHEFVPWSRKLPWRRDGYPLQYSCLENIMDRGAWWAKVYRISKSQTQLKWLSTYMLSMSDITNIWEHANYIYSFLYQLSGW